MNELKPCPFCGSKHVHGEKVKRDIYRVECWCCGASVESVASIDKAIKWWNMRAIDKDELLRCKECKYGKAVKQIGCIRVIDRMTKQGPQDENGFCSLAERNGEK